MSQNMNRAAGVHSRRRFKRPPHYRPDWTFTRRQRLLQDVRAWFVVIFIAIGPWAIANALRYLGLL